MNIFLIFVLGYYIVGIAGYYIYKKHKYNEELDVFGDNDTDKRPCRIISRYIIYMDFNFCLWFINSENHDWKKYTNGFYPHLTIKSQLEYKDALELYETIKNIDPITIRLKNEVTHTNENGFHALYFKVDLISNTNKIINEIKNPHISFRYQYNKDFSEKEIEKLQTTVKEKFETLNKVKLVNCQGHYENWHFLK